MITEQKLLWMFEQVHGELTNQFKLKLDYDDSMNPIAVEIWKNGNRCQTATKLDLIFDYLTKHL